MPLVNFQKEFRILSFDFARIFMFEHVRSDWAYAEPNIFDDPCFKIDRSQGTILNVLVSAQKMVEL